MQCKEEIGYQEDPGAVREGGTTAMEGERTTAKVGQKPVGEEQREVEVATGEVVVVGEGTLV